jgi:hypothetical protein
MYLMCIKRVVNLSTKQKLNSVFVQMTWMYVVVQMGGGGNCL